MLQNSQILNNKKIGLIIDLTDKSKYYDHTFFTERNIIYQKIICDNEMIPKQQMLKIFISTVKKYLEQNNDGLIVCHCLYGYNITGFFIVYFMVKELGYNTLEAINLFNRARQPGIFKKIYYEALFKQFGQTSIPRKFKKPIIPIWGKIMLKQKNEQIMKKSNNVKESRLDNAINKKKNSNLIQYENGEGDEDKDENGGENGDENRDENRDENGGEDEGNKNKKQRRLYSLLETIGERVNSNTEEELKNIICKWFNYKEKNKFLGTIPVPLTKSNAKTLTEHQYYVTWNALGDRCMLLILNEKCYLIGKNFKFYKVSAKFPKINKTIMDGELVAEPIASSKSNNSVLIGKTSKKMKYIFLVFDALFYNGKPYFQKNLGERLGVVKHLINFQKNHLSKSNLQQYLNDPFQMKFKDIYELKHAKTILNQLQPNIAHPNNGLIFTPVNQPYIFHNSNSLLKWIPFKEQKILFLIKNFKNSNRKTAGLFVLNKTSDNDFSGNGDEGDDDDDDDDDDEDGDGGNDDEKNNVNVGGEKNKVGELIKVDVIHFSDLYQKIRYLLKIVECYFDFNTEKWKPKEIFLKKKCPDTLEKYEKLIKIMDKNFNKKQLLEYIQKIIIK
ncbi:mRNA-capping enzyme [Anaeramoeba flamelloides]|uniref:mRNA-capping enzyme n=1 Tax=Anaeramoeba flamelloides TaxID=1746091 RepID=A0AAV7YT59_9EUKA|nr:mRNA-capping enzyme [Anaeramoeba flamelloides]